MTHASVPSRAGAGAVTPAFRPCAAAGRPGGALAPARPVAEAHVEEGRRLGHDWYCHTRLPACSDWPAALREGFAQAREAGFARRAPADRWHRKWLQLRLGAWLRGLPCDAALTPQALRALGTERCPVTLQTLTHGTRSDSDASIDRLDNRRGYHLGNLAVMSLRANRAKADMDLAAVEARARAGVASRGLSPAQWARLAALMAGATPAPSALAPTPHDLTQPPTPTPPMPFITTSRSTPVAAPLRPARPRWRAPRRAAWASVLSALACSAIAQVPSADAGPSTRVEVTGARLGKVDASLGSAALPAAVEVLDAERIERLNVRSYSDLFRTVPGVQSINFGQGDIGAPFVMRGFGGGGSHGVATAVFIDGVPQNIPSGGIGGNGTSEYNWLTPEMIERVEVIKGPFSALYGDQALAGVVNIVTRRCTPSRIGVEAGSYGLARVAGAGCHAAEDGRGATLFGAFEAYHSDGYRARSVYDRVSVLGKATLTLGASEVSLRGNVYRSVYEAPGYLDFDQVRAGLLDPRSSLYPSDGGDNTRFSLVGTLAPQRGEAGWHGTLYIDRFERARFSSFNPAMPLAQSLAIDERTVFGGRLHRHWSFDGRGALTAGVDTRLDRGDIGSFATRLRERTGVVNSDYGLDIRSLGAFVQAQWLASEDLKLVGGVRVDRFEHDIDNRRRPERSGSGSQSVSSPRVGLVYRVSPQLSVYANAGQGFRSLGAPELSPAGATGVRDFGLAIPKGRTRDLGFNARFNGLAVNGNVYRTEIDSELRQEPPGSGILANIGSSERNGWELDARWRASDGFVLYGSFAHLDARVRNPLNPVQTKLQNATPELVTLGLEATRPTAAGRLLLDAQLQHTAPETYYVGNVERETEPWQVINLRATLEQGRFSWFAHATLEPRRFGSDQAGNSFNPKPRRQFGVGLRYAL